MLDNGVYTTNNWRRPNTNESNLRLHAVHELIKEIELGGDESIIKFSKRYDGFVPEHIELMPFESYGLEDKLAEAIQAAAKRIETFCKFQKESLADRSFSDDTGSYGYCYQAIKRIGAYIPGGRFPLISTALMTLIPAKVAGCEERVACSPSDHPAILAAASLAGATSFIKIGGVQAVSAMALGFQSISPVQMIVGPGNQYVNAAKQYFQSQLAIDVPAGPSELLILAGEEANLEWIVKDMAAQAEHDPQAHSVFVTDNQALLGEVYRSLKADEYLWSLFVRDQICLVSANDPQDMIQFSDEFAPEHLLLADTRIESKQLTSYGAIFIGDNSAVAFGDYCSGPNHTLPTMGTAKYSSGLNVASFLKVQTIQQVTDKGRQILAPIADALAEAEQLVWHKRSIEVRSC
ncbi:histidinol dehydrogenase [Kangiella sp. HZ709]|uniref:histidinol dehydrogenase n=1 Tax=Kangiella sp. HZ709 TaxID=2666328 RepID=UPI0012B053A5|nr:histidinol dehydrogenase [Kangiella sp. HZ709]MRX28379.1 histidinol dehydrogenase [Kangiella sp. HZ709]